MDSCRDLWKYSTNPPDNSLWISPRNRIRFHFVISPQDPVRVRPRVFFPGIPLGIPFKIPHEIPSSLLLRIPQGFLQVFSRDFLLDPSRDSTRDSFIDFRDCIGNSSQDSFIDSFRDFLTEFSQLSFRVPPWSQSEFFQWFFPGFFLDNDPGIPKKYFIYFFIKNLFSDSSQDFFFWVFSWDFFRLFPTFLSGFLPWFPGTFLSFFFSNSFQNSFGDFIWDF